MTAKKAKSKTKRAATAAAAGLSVADLQVRLDEATTQIEALRKRLAEQRAEIEQLKNRLELAEEVRNAQKAILGRLEVIQTFSRDLREAGDKAVQAAEKMEALMATPPRAAPSLAEEPPPPLE